MTRTLRTLALVTIAFSLVLAIYSFSQSSYGFDGDMYTAFLAQLLRTTVTALGLSLAVLALVASAQTRRLGWLSAYMVLAIVTTFGPEFVTFPPVDIWFFRFLGPSAIGDAYGQLLTLSFCIPPVATALLVLGEDSRNRLWHTTPSPTGGEADDLEITALRDEVR